MVSTLQEIKFIHRKAQRIINLYTPTIDSNISLTLTLNILFFKIKFHFISPKRNNHYLEFGIYLSSPFQILYVYSKLKRVHVQTHVCTHTHTHTFLCIVSSLHKQHHNVSYSVSSKLVSPKTCH